MLLVHYESATERTVYVGVGDATAGERTGIEFSFYDDLNRKTHDLPKFFITLGCTYKYYHLINDAAYVVDSSIPLWSRAPSQAKS